MGTDNLVRGVWGPGEVFTRETVSTVLDANMSTKF